MDRETIFYAIFLIGVFVSAVSQALLKKAALRQYPSFWRQYLNPLVILAYTLFVGVSVLNTITYRVIPLSVGTVLETTGYLYIILFGALFFREKITVRKLLAIACIVSGSIICALLG